jgi:hypothetical protein
MSLVATWQTTFIYTPDGEVSFKPQPYKDMIIDSLNFGGRKGIKSQNLINHTTKSIMTV